METHLKDLCTKHGLNHVTFSYSERDPAYRCSLILHWDGKCAVGVGDTFDEALVDALVDMAERRTARAA